MANTNAIAGNCLIQLMPTLAHRIKTARQNAQLTQAQLAAKAGVRQSTIANLEAGTRKNPRELLEIAKALGVTPDALKYGSDLDAEQALPDSGGLRVAKQSLASYLQSNVSTAPVGTRRVPLVSYVQAGRFTECVQAYKTGDDANHFLLTDLALSDLAFALRIRGDSMLPEFREGDAVIIDPQVTPQPGDFVVARNGDHEATFKKYRPRGTNSAGLAVFELVPLNDDFATMRSDVDQLVIMGTMVEHRRYRKRQL